MKTNEKPFHIRQLEKTFQDRIKMNARYSLRAFARDVGISVSRLSGVLNQKFGLSQASAKEICETLAYESKIADCFITSVVAHHARSLKARDAAKMKIASRQRVFSQLELDRFEVISDWYHFAIMELSRITSLKQDDYVLISQELQISAVLARAAVVRLLELNLLKIESGFLIQTGSYFVGGQKVASNAIRNLNSQLIDKAKSSIHEQDLNERDLRTLTLAVSKDSMPAFNQLFNEFQAKVKKIAENTPRKTDVYAWTMQFHRLSERKIP